MKSPGRIWIGIGTNPCEERRFWTTEYREPKATAPTGRIKTRQKTEYVSIVIVHRKGDFVFPVTLEVKFDNGETLHQHWDGQDRWHRYTWQEKAKLVSAEIDPEHGILLDRDCFNNSWLADSNSHASGKIAGYWMLCTQWFAQLLAWLA